MSIELLSKDSRVVSADPALGDQPDSDVLTPQITGTGYWPAVMVESGPNRTCAALRSRAAAATSVRASDMRSPGTASPRRKLRTTFQRVYGGAVSEVRRVRADLATVAAGCPIADELVLLASELATNAIVHSRSGEPGSTFTVRAELQRDAYAWVEVEDQGGGDWNGRDGEDQDAERGRGLAIVGAIAGDGNWGIETGDTPESCVVWVRLAWCQDEDA